MFCSNCGNPVQEGQAVCLSCGFSLNNKKSSNGVGWFDAPSHNGKRRGVVALCAWFFGLFGVHRFMMDDNKNGAFQLILTLSSVVLIVPIFVTAVWALMDFFWIVSTDEDEFANLFTTK